MSYFRSFFVNFLVVFLANKISPGIQVIYFDQLPDVITDIVFSLFVGFFNASIFPLLTILELTVTKARLVVLTLIVSYGAYLLTLIFPFGIQLTGASGIIVGATFVWIGAYCTNFFEWKAYKNR